MRCLSTPVAPINLRLEMAVYFKEPIWSSGPACSDFLSVIDSSPIFSIAERALRAIRPRKKWDTDLGITVGSIRSTKVGQHYVGSRQMAEGVQKLNDLLASQRLGQYRRHHWTDELSVAIGVALSRDLDGQPTRPIALTSVKLRSPATASWAGEFSDAMFETFVATLNVSTPLTAWASWWGPEGLNYHYEWLSGMAASHERGEAIVPGTRAILHLPPAAVGELGGVDAVRRDAPVLDVREIPGQGDEAGVAVRLCRLPDELTEERLTGWRSYLLPVLDLPSEDRVPSNWTNRPANGWLSNQGKPLDILSSDFRL
jgi:hypothetical protein